MEQHITIFHGSEKIVGAAGVRLRGRGTMILAGFCCTASEALAKEWAVSSLRDGFVNRYTLDTRISKYLEFEQPGLYHPQLDRGPGGTPPLCH